MSVRTRVIGWRGRTGWVGILALTLSWLPASVSAQTIGTFSWLLAPYCNVMTLTVTVDGVAYRLSGFDDACGSVTRMPVSGSVSPNSNGTFTLSLTVVTPNGLPSHITTVVGPPTYSGTWSDNTGLSGTFEFGRSPTAGSPPRPEPFVRSFTIADGTIGAVDINSAQVQARVNGTCGAGQFVQGVNQNGTVQCGAGGGGGTLTGVTAGSGLTGGGSSGNVSLSVAPLGITGPLIAGGAVDATKLSFPIGVSQSSGSSLFAIQNSGAGPAISAVGSGAGTALIGQALGTGQVAQFTVTSAANTSNALALTHAGLGRALAINVSNASNNTPAIDISKAGNGEAINIVATGLGPVIRLTSSAFVDGVSASTAGLALHGVATSISGAGVLGDNATGEAVVGRSQGGNGVGAVVGRSDGAGYGVRGFNTSSGIGVLGQSGNSGGTGVAGRFENLNAANASVVLAVSSNGTGDLVTATQSGNIRFRVQNNGNVTADGSFTGGGADVAEFIDAVDALEPGDVVEVDSAADGRFRKSTHASSTAVAGVVTTKPGLLMNANDERRSLDDGPALALAGRVPVKVTDEGGSIRPGDLLVAAPTAGHAMRAPDQPRPGSVIGKALGRLGTGTGVVEMLVMLR